MELFKLDEGRLDAIELSAPFNGIDLTKVQCKVDGKGIDDMTDEEKFIEGKKSIGGSEVGEILKKGFSGVNGPSIVYDRKVRKEPEVLDDKTKETFAKGHFCEPYIFDLVAKNLPEGWKAILDKSRYRDVERAYMHADFDMILVSPTGEKFIGEIKSYNDIPGRQKLESGTFGEPKHLLSSGAYEWQVRYYMRELNTRAGVVFSHPMVEKEEDFTINRLNVCVIYRDFNKEKKMIEEIDNFWLNHVEKLDRPDFTSLSEKAYNSALDTDEVPFEKDKKIKLPSACKEWLFEYNQNQLDIKSLKEKIEAIENRNRALEYCIIVNMDDAQKGTLKSGSTVFMVERGFKKGRSSWDTKALEKDHPEMVIYKKEGKESRKFEIKSFEDTKNLS